MIEVKNPKGVHRGISEMIVDGKSINGNVITPFKDKKTHKVVAIMG